MQSRSTKSNFVVEKTESQDLGHEYYNGAGLALNVDVQTKTGELFAVVRGQAVHVANLSCEFTEFSPR